MNKSDIDKKNTLQGALRMNEYSKCLLFFDEKVKEKGQQARIYCADGNDINSSTYCAILVINRYILYTKANDQYKIY